MEDSPSGLWRTLGKRVGCKPSRVRISYPPRLIREPLNGGVPGFFYSSLGSILILLWPRYYGHKTYKCMAIQAPESQDRPDPCITKILLPLPRMTGSYFILTLWTHGKKTGSSQYWMGRTPLSLPRWNRDMLLLQIPSSCPATLSSFPNAVWGSSTICLLRKGQLSCVI